jgi:hypothetical protein
MNKIATSAIIVAALSAALGGCSNEATVASQNLSQAADNFGINRRIVFFNGITDKYILEIEGLCSIGKGDSVPREITVTCKTGPTDYKKHFLGISDNVTFFSEQLDAAKVSTFHYRVTFNPAAIIPSIDLR